MSTTYLVTIEGSAFVTDPLTGIKGVKPYEVDVKFDKQTIDKYGALSAFCKFVAADLMPTILPGYKGLETHRVVKSVGIDGAVVRDIRLMNLFDMEVYIRDKELPIEIELYRDDPEKLRQAIEDYEKEPQAFLKAQKRNMELYGEHVATKNRIKALNAEIVPKAKTVAKHKVELEPVAAAAVPEKKASKKNELGI